MKKLRGAAVGAGYFSQFHFDAWNRLDDVELLAVCDSDAAVARQAAATYSIPNSYRDFCAMLDEVQPDFVDIITLPDSHLDLTVEAAKRGIAVICQKPLAPTFAEAQRIVQIAEAAGIPFMVHENFRFQPWYREVRKIIDAETIGNILQTISFRMRTGDGYGSQAYLSRQPYFRQMERFLIHETGVHFIDIFRYLGGEVRQIGAILRRFNPEIVGEDAGLLTFEFENGAVGTWDANRCNETSARDPRYTFGTLHVECNSGSLRMDEDGRLFIKLLSKPEYEHNYSHEKSGFAGDCVFRTQKHFVERLRNGKSFETDGRSYLRTLQLVEEAYASAGEVIVPGVNTDAASHLDTAVPVAVLPSDASPNKRVVDLSLPIENGMRGVDISQATTIASQGWNSTTLTLYSHCGTHMDAPVHFLGAEGATIDQQPLEVCQGPARIVDLTPVEPSELLTVRRFMDAGGDVSPGERLLLRTDWSIYAGTNTYRDQLPRISPELARWLVRKQTVLIGVETPSVADVNNLNEVTEVHQILFRGGVVIVEGLTNLNLLQQSTVEFSALPLLIRNGDGCPVRAIAIEEGNP